MQNTPGDKKNKNKTKQKEPLTLYFSGQGFLQFFILVGHQVNLATNNYCKLFGSSWVTIQDGKFPICSETNMT